MPVRLGWWRTAAREKWACKGADWTAHVVYGEARWMFLGQLEWRWENADMPRAIFDTGQGVNAMFAMIELFNGMLIHEEGSLH